MISKIAIKRGRLDRKYLLKELSAELEWEVTSIKSPNGRLSSGDVRDYYMRAKEELLKRMKDKDIAFAQKGGDFDFAQIKQDRGDVSDPEDINYWINKKTVSFQFVIGSDTDSFWVEVNPGKNFDFEKTKKVTGDFAEIMISIPTTKSVETFFSGNNGFIIVGKLKEPQKVEVVKELLAEKLEDYCEDKSNITIGEGDDDQLQLDISQFKNTGSFPVPYSLNSETGLVIVPVLDIGSFKKEDAEIKKMFKRFKKLSSLKKQAKFNPSSVSSTSSNIGSVNIDTKLDAEKIKNALKYLEEKDQNAFAKARDFDFIVSDISAKDAGLTIPGEKVAAWFNPAYSEVCFIFKDYVDGSSIEDIASTILHEAQHGRYPGHGEWTAEKAEERFEARLKRKTLLAKLVTSENVVQFSKNFRSKLKENKRIDNDFYDDIIEDAKDVRTENDFDKFTARYKIEDMAGAYAPSAALGINQYIYKGGEGNINEDDKIDMLQNVLFHPERKYGLRKAIDTYKAGKGTSLHTHILNYVSALKGASSWVINALMKDPAWYPQDLRSKEEEQEGVKERKLERLTDGDVYTTDDMSNIAFDLSLLIDSLKKGVAKWGPNPVTKDSQQALLLLSYVLTPILGGPAAEFFEKYRDELINEKELMEAVGIKIPELTCLDCGQRYELYNQSKSLKENADSLKKNGCEKVNDALEHQPEWNDSGKYDKDRAITDLGYQYRIGIERQSAGSNSGISPIAIDKKKVTAASDKYADKFRVPLNKKEKPVSQKWRELAKTQIETEKTLEEVSKDSYEYKRLAGLNFKEEEGIESKNHFDKVIRDFRYMLETSPQTKDVFREFQEANSTLSNLSSGETSYSLRQVEDKK